jgi:integrase
VLAIKPFVSRQVWGLIELQLLTGARGGELLVMRGCDLDASKPTWTYKPASHKTMHHGHERIIHLGPQAISIVKQFLRANPQDYLFSPSDAEAERRAKLHAARKTPADHGNGIGTNRVRRPKKSPQAHYTKDSYARCIARAIVKANRWLKGGKIIGNDEVSVEHWHPHRLRHAAATKIRKGFGLEASRCVLGQHSDAVAELYAERDQNLAAAVAAQIG